jgi:hypothetical protein
MYDLIHDLHYYMKIAFSAVAMKLESGTLQSGSVVRQILTQCRVAEKTPGKRIPRRLVAEKHSAIGRLKTQTLTHHWTRGLRVLNVPLDIRSTQVL